MTPLQTVRRAIEAPIDHMKVRTKLLAGFSVVFVLLLLVVGVQARALQHADSSGNALYKEGAQPIVALYALNGDLDGERIRAYRHGMAATADSKKEYESQIGEKEALVNEDLAAYAKLFPGGFDATRQGLVDKFKANLAAYRSVVHDKFLAASNAHSPALATITEKELSPTGKDAGDVLDDLSQLEIKHAAAVRAGAQSDANSNTHLVIVLVSIAIVLAAGCALLVATSVNRSVRALGRVLDHLADGDLTQHANLTSRDEFGHMSAALDRAVSRTREAMTRIAASSQALAASSQELTMISTEVGSSAEETSAQASTVSAAAEHVSANVSSVASGAEEMSASIDEIARHASDASAVASTAVTEAATTNQTITELGESSSQIGDVVKTITSIAEQTNLLALNATIEAARAGEMGKGFAVVANEVKELAQQTAQATADVGARITSIQSNTTAAVGAISRIVGTIEQINEATGTIAAAVEEQAATTNEIGRSAQEAAQGAGEIAQNITGVAAGAAETTASVSQTRSTAQEVARTAGELETVVGQFRVDA